MTGSVGDLRWGGHDPADNWPPPYRLTPAEAGHRRASRPATLVGPMAGEPWLSDAACAGTAVEMFPDVGDTAGIAAALAVCAGCPVQVPCAELAAELPLSWRRHGVWGGRRPTYRARCPADEADRP